MAPTLIDMAGHSIPDHMDGQSVLRLLKSVRDPKKWVWGFVDEFTGYFNA